MTTAIEYALMAGASYISTRPDPNKFPIPQGWVKVVNPDSYVRDPDSGFEAISFTSGTEIVISFAGTYDNPNNPLTNPDMQADFGLATGLGSAQLLQAAEYYLQVKASAPAGANISLTGHSLGGGLAALVGVFFGVSATTFDQAPFAKSAELNLLTPDVAANLKTTLSAKLDANGNRLYSDAALTGLTNFLQLRQTNGGTPNSGLVTDISVEGQLLSDLPYSLFNTIGTEQQPPLASSHAGVEGGDLHSQALLTAFLQSDVTALTNAGQKQSLSQVTYKLADLLKMIFDKNLFAYKTDDPDNRNFIDHLVRHEFGNASGVIAPDAMVARFTSDLWKLAQDGGMTVNEGIWSAYSNLNNVSKALIAFAMQKYYEENSPNTTYGAELFTDLSAAGAGSNGIRFDMADVSQNIAAAISGNAPVDLAGKQDGKYILKGYEYFLNYLDNTSPLAPAERTLVKSMLPALRDWYVQAGASGMNATDTLNRGAFMLGGNGSDALVGGTAADLLVGNAGADLLQGGGGN
ncbi:MAG: hypothetical protein HZC43_08260, partial [Nitrosomonadales bacterium]|nr:hypothetical protein [Nitrosomonadales bacterium]